MSLAEFVVFASNNKIAVIFFVSNILCSLSFLCRDILSLRLLAIACSIGFFIGGFIMPAQTPGRMTNLVFASINALVNFIQSILIILDRKPLLVPDEILDLYKLTFHTLKPNEFLKIYKLATLHTERENEILTVQNHLVPALILIKQGTASVVQDGENVAKLTHGYFVGEMSFLSNKPANATVFVSSKELIYLRWDKEQLAKLKVNNISLFEKLEACIALNLIQKIDLQVQKNEIHRLSRA